MSLNKNINSVQDYEDVLIVVKGYVEGLKTGSDLRIIWRRYARMPKRYITKLFILFFRVTLR